jgi:hypothetical protein
VTSVVARGVDKTWLQPAAVDGGDVAAGSDCVERPSSNGTSLHMSWTVVMMSPASSPAVINLRRAIPGDAAI